MLKAVPNALVENYEELIPSIELPDPNDRHVLAAAIKSGADAIITFNLKHFPPEFLEKYEIEAQHPDEFIYNQFDLDQSAVVIAAQRCRARLKNPPKSAEDYLAILHSQQLPKTVSELLNYKTVI